MKCKVEFMNKWENFLRVKAMLMQLAGINNDEPVLFLVIGGRTTTCMVMTSPGGLPNVILESATVFLFSKTLPACMSFTSFTDFGTSVLPVKQRLVSN